MAKQWEGEGYFQATCPSPHVECGNLNLLARQNYKHFHSTASKLGEPLYPGLGTRLALTKLFYQQNLLFSPYNELVHLEQLTFSIVWSKVNAVIGSTGNVQLIRFICGKTDIIPW